MPARIDVIRMLDSYLVQVRLKADTTYTVFSGNEEARVVDVFLASEHHLGTLVVLLTDVLEELGIRAPVEIEVTGRPRLRVGARIVDRHLIAHRVLVDAGEALDELQVRGVRCAAGVDPELLVQTARFDDQGVALPLADRVAV